MSSVEHTLENIILETSCGVISVRPKDSERGSNFGTFPFAGPVADRKHSYNWLLRNGTSLRVVNTSLEEFKKWGKIKREMLEYIAHTSPLGPRASPHSEGSPTDWGQERTSSPGY